LDEEPDVEADEELIELLLLMLLDTELDDLCDVFEGGPLAGSLRR